MKVTVKAYLNARIGKASTDATCIDFKIPGETIDVENVLIGTEINGNAVWYKNKDDGCFYWSEGVEEEWFLLNESDVYAGLNDADRHVLIRSLIYSLLSTLKPGNHIQSLAVGSVKGDTGLIVDVLPGFNQTELTLREDKKLVFKGINIPYAAVDPSIFKPNSPIHIYEDISTPFVMGGSVSGIPDDNLGTRGIKVTKDGKPLLLTCYHVACFHLLRQRITEFDGSNILLNIPSVDARSTVPRGKGKVTDGILNRFFDFAAIDLENLAVTNVMSNIGIINEAYTRTDYNKLKLGDTLRTFGCVSRGGSQKITRINQGPVIIDYEFVGLVGIIETIETELMSVEGDSGAPVVDARNKLVGLIIANNTIRNRSIIMPIHQLFFIKNYNI
jgi:hypothetical protein